jgi:hypothetical protein
MTELYWMFKPMPGGVACLGIEVFPDGDYWVYDSPTGTYSAGHRDKGKWRAVYDEYRAQGYVPEDAAKAAGLIPQSWTRQPPRPPWAGIQRRARRRFALWLSIALLLLAALLFAVLSK